MWRTADEIKFINGLGQHCDPKRVVPYEEKLEYLRRYLRGCQRRVLWAGINRTTVTEYAEERIRYYEDLISRTNER